MDTLSVADTQVIEAQIGRTLRGENGIALRCSYGFPQVLQVHPVLGHEPFPTLYWLTCPFLSKRIDHLESVGSIPRLEDRMRQEPELRAAMHEAHARYRDKRNALLRAEERTTLGRTGMLAALETRGIGGIADFEGIKCLHLHVAHALIDENPIGAIVLEMLDTSECPQEKVICPTLV